MNIVQIFYARPHLGGSGIMSMELAKELSKKGHNVKIVSYPNTFLTQEEKDMGLEIYPVDDIAYPCFKAEPYSATFASQIYNIFKETGNIDIIHANYAITHGEAALMARNIIGKHHKVPKIIVTSHGSDIHTNGMHRLLGPSINNTLNESDKITFVSEALQKEAISLFDLDDKGEIIYNFIDETKFHPADNISKMQQRDELGISRNKFVIYHASNFRPLKQTELLIDVAKNLKHYGKNDFIFLLVGDGPEKQYMENRAKTEGLEDMVYFAGKQNNVVPYIQASDVGILPSKRESFGLALLEAMACKLPVIGSNVGGIPEVINDGVSGFLFNYKDIGQLTSQLINLASSRQLCISMGNEGYKIATTRFSRDDIVKQYESLYLNLLN